MRIRKGDLIRWTGSYAKNMLGGHKIGIVLDPVAGLESPIGFLWVYVPELNQKFRVQIYEMEKL